MSTIVVYQSETGFTKKYAEWIAEELGCEVVPFKKTNATKLQGYDKVIYGGWLMGGMIVGVEKVREFGLKELIVFATGASPAMEEAVKQQESGQSENCDVSESSENKGIEKNNKEGQ